MIQDFIRRTNKYTHKHSPIIMTAIGVAGVATTAYLTATASFKAARALDAVPDQSDDLVQRTKENVQLTWKFYIPPVTTGVVTVGAIAYANRLGSKRTAAAISAYTVTERAFTEYRKKVVEEIGSHQERVIRDDAVQEVIGKTNSETIIMAGGGEVMCCDLYTHRYFMSDMESLRRAENQINSKIVNELYVSLEEFYNLIGLRSPQHASELGWDSDKLLELDFTTVMSEDGRPCLAFSYNYVKPI